MSEISKLIVGFMIYFLVQFLPNISIMSTKKGQWKYLIC